MVNIRVHLTLTRFYSKNVIALDIEHPVLLVDILNQLGIPSDEVGMVVKNGKWEPVECEVSDNDSIEVFPILSGG